MRTPSSRPQDGDDRGSSPLAVSPRTGALSVREHRICGRGCRGCSACLPGAPWRRRGGERGSGFGGSPAVGELVQSAAGVLWERGRRLYQAHDRLLLNDWAAECAVPGLTDLDAGDLRKVLARTGESVRRLVAAAVAA